MKNLKTLLLVGLLALPSAAAATADTTPQPAPAVTQTALPAPLTDEQLDQAQGKFAPAAAAPFLAVPGVGEVVAAGAALYVIYRGGETLGNYLASQSEADKNRANSKAKGIPDSQIGPSGLPKVHGVDHDNRKDAKEAAESNSAKGQQPMYHPSDVGQSLHYHPVDQNSDKKLPNVHHNFPK